MKKIYRWKVVEIGPTNRTQIDILSFEASLDHEEVMKEANRRYPGRFLKVEKIIEDPR